MSPDGAAPARWPAPGITTARDVTDGGARGRRPVPRPLPAAAPTRASRTTTGSRSISATTRRATGRCGSSPTAGSTRPTARSTSPSSRVSTRSRRRWSLEVPDGQGGWKVARDKLGFPAGKNKTILLALDGLDGPGVARRLRLRTNLEIYWDALRYARGRRRRSGGRKRDLLPLVADLRPRGILAMTQARPQLAGIARTTIALLPGGRCWRDLIGYHTRFGDVRELLATGRRSLRDHEGRRRARPAVRALRPLRRRAGSAISSGSATAG